jgi:hypothetical protein
MECTNEQEEKSESSITNPTLRRNQSLKKDKRREKKNKNSVQKDI